MECADRTKFHAGYPYNLDYDFEDLFPFMKYSINNLGDPYVKSNYGVHSRVFEQAVIDFFARMWKLDDDYWGYVTSCGTEGNLHSILLARENHPDGVLMSSTQTHYSVTLTRKKHLEKMSEPVEYLNSIDTTIMGSRNGHAALFMWYALKTKGIKGLEKDVLLCFDNAKYLYQKLIQAGIHAERNDLSTTVVLERPNEEFVQRRQLACEGDIAHVVVMPNITRIIIDRFVDELVNEF